MTLPVSKVKWGTGDWERATNWHAVRGARPAGSTVDVRIHLATLATELHNSVEARLKELHKRFHPCEFTPDEPAPPWD